MHRASVGLSLLTVLVLVLSGLMVFARLAPASGLNIGSLPDFCRNFCREQERERDLSDKLNTMREQQVAKCEVLADLLAGRCTLAQAAGLFQEIDGPKELARLRLVYEQPSASPLEVYAWQILLYVKSHLRDQPDLQQASLVRLQSELNQLQSTTVQ